MTAIKKTNKPNTRRKVNTKTIVELVYTRHLKLFRELNDIHIFVSRTVPLLETAAAKHKDELVDLDEDIKFYVPGKNGSKGVARRNNTELSSLFRRFSNRELYENLLISSVSRFEFYLADVIRSFLLRNTKKLTIGVKGGDTAKNISVQLVIELNDMNEIIEELINQRLQLTFQASPQDYCAYFNAVSELGIANDLFADFFEIKATRDLIVHNSLYIDEQYLKKAGDKSRGKINEKLKVTKNYFENSLSIFKTISTQIEKSTREKFAKPDEELELDKI